MWQGDVRIFSSLKDRVRGWLFEDDHRLFLWMPVCFATGIWSYFSLSTEPSWLIFACIGILALLTCFLRIWVRSGFSFLLLGLFFFLIGIEVAKYETFRVSHPILKQRSLQSNALEGRILFADNSDNNKQRLLLAIPALGKEHQPLVARMKWSGAPLSPGKTITFKGRLYAPSSPGEPGSYHQARRLFFSSIGASGVIDDVLSVRVSHHEEFWEGLSTKLAQARWVLAEKIAQEFTGKDHVHSTRGALAVALVTGMRGGINTITWDRIRGSGLAHLLAISGLHMGLVCGFVFWLLRAFFALFPSLTLRFQVRRWAALGALLVGFCYLLISGMTVSSTRAFLMVGVMLFAIMLNRRALTMRNVSLAALLILGIWPHSLLEAGFLMSFMTTAALIAVFEKWERLPFWRTLFFSSGVAFFVSSLLSLWIFNRTALYALPVNIVVLPWMSFMVMPFLLLFVVFLPLGWHTLFVPFAQWGLDGILWLTQWVSALPHAFIWLSSVPSVGIVCLFIGGLWLMIWQARWRYFGLVFLLVGMIVSIVFLEERPMVVISPRADVVGMLVQKGGYKRILAGSGTYAPFQWHKRDGGHPQERLARVRKRFSGDFHAEKGSQCFVGLCFLVEKTSSKPLIVGYVWRLDTLADACHYADVVVVRMAILLPRCGKALVVTSLDTYCVGSINLWWDGKEIRVSTAKQWEGVRPWTVSWQRSFPSWLFAEAPFQSVHEKERSPSWKQQCFEGI